jgi:hypothetical protein
VVYRTDRVEELIRIPTATRRACTDGWVSVYLGMMPYCFSSVRLPSMVHVLPVPVCPYAKTVQLKPSSTCQAPTHAHVSCTHPPRLHHNLATLLPVGCVLGPVALPHLLTDVLDAGLEHILLRSEAAQHLCPGNKKQEKLGP